jgi:hypothetical protein
MMVSLALGYVGPAADRSAKLPTLPQEADVTVMGIQLNSTKSAVKVLGERIEVIDGDDMPRAEFLNSAGTEWLALVQHYGSEGYSFQEIEIVPAGPRTPATAKKLPKVEKFVTGKGIHLGMTKSQLVQILGDGFVIEKGRGEILTYGVYDEKSPFLQFFRQWRYYGRYTFKKEKLAAIAFGFEYP